MAIRNGKIYISNEEIELFRNSNFQEIYERNKDHFYEYYELTQHFSNRLNYQLRRKFCQEVGDNLCVNFPEELRYKLINKYHFIKNVGKFDINQLSDDFLKIISPQHFNLQQLEIYFQRTKLFPTTPNNFFDLLTLLPARRNEVTKIFVRDLLADKSSHHKGEPGISQEVIYSFKHAFISSTKNHSSIQTFIRNQEFYPDQEIYQALKEYVYDPVRNSWELRHVLTEFLLLGKETQESLNENLSNISHIDTSCFSKLSSEFVYENIDKLLPKLSVDSTIDVITKWPEFQEKAEALAVENKDHNFVHQFSKQFYVDKNNRVKLPGFITHIVELNKWYLNSYKDHPDFRLPIIEKYKANKKKTAIRTRTSVLSDFESNCLIAKRIYEKYVHENIEEYVEKSWHKFHTIMEYEIGKIIYDNMKVAAKIEEFCLNEDLKFMVERGGETLIINSLCKEIGNFARGTKYFLEHEKEINKNIKSIKKIERVISG